MKRSEFYEIISTPESAYQFAKEKGIVIYNPSLCNKCGSQMFFERGKTRLCINGRFLRDRHCRESMPLMFKINIFRQ